MPHQRSPANGARAPSSQPLASDGAVLPWDGAGAITSSGYGERPPAGEGADEPGNDGSRAAASVLGDSGEPRRATVAPARDLWPRTPGRDPRSGLLTPAASGGCRAAPARARRRRSNTRTAAGGRVRQGRSAETNMPQRASRWANDSRSAKSQVRPLPVIPRSVRAGLNIS